MKKTLSVLLAALLVLLTFAPAAIAAEGGTYYVEFVAPSATLENDANGVAPYTFVKIDPATGTFVFKEDNEHGRYVIFNGKYTALDNILFLEDYTFTEFYSPEVYSGVYQVEAGEVIAFTVQTNNVYNGATAAIYVNGEPYKKSGTDPVYTLYMDRNYQITVNETDANGNPVLLRNMFSVNMPSDEGYKVKTLEGENYSLVPYGGSFSFRVKITKGYTDSGMTVKAIRGASGLTELLGDDADSLLAMLPSNLPGMEAGGDLGIAAPETLSSTGIDSNGYRIYTINNITSETRIVVSGVREEKSSNFISILKRLLKLLLDLLGIQSDIFGSITDTNEVIIDANESERFSYSVVSGFSGNEVSPSAFEVASGDSVTLQLATSYADCDNHINISWVFYDDEGTPVKTVTGDNYNSKWTAKRNASTGAIYYTKLVVIDNITSNVKVTITETK